MDLAKYASLFLTESREHLAACNQLLLAWERDPSAVAPVDGLFRAIHTIKGMAATMGYANLADLSHRIENLLDAARTGRVRADDDVLQLLFLAVDALAAGVERAAAGDDAGVREAVLVEALDRVAGGGSAALETAHPAGGAPAERPSGPRPLPAEEPAGDVPRLIRVRIAGGAAMRGARALLALRRAEALGRVHDVTPPPAQFERDDFAGAFSFRFAGEVADGPLLEAVRSAGEVESAEVDAVPVAAPAPREARRIRVELRRLDALMKQVGELVVAKNRLVDVAVSRDEPELDELAGRIARLVGGMQEEILAARMAPVGEVFARFPRTVRDLARDLGKQVVLETEGDAIELDRAILDELGEPLLHLVRNAVDHGLESPDERTAAGKPAAGRIRLTAVRERNTVAIGVADDGRGVDRERVLARARAEGMIGDDVDPASLSDERLLQAIAQPGFSTAGQVSGVSGRGVGVDVVATRLRALGGTLDIRTTPGAGTTWTLRVPLTLAIVRALLTRVGGERYAVPLAYVAETVEFDGRLTTTLRDREALVLRDRVIPTVHLRELVAAPGEPPAAGARRPTVILEVGDRRSALVVEALLGQQDIVVEPFEAPRGMPRYLGGATILADGVPALILDAAALV